MRYILLALKYSSSQLDLATALSHTHTVCMPDRRGRGLSGPMGATHCVEQEVEDLHALLETTGASRVLGVSSGAIVCLQAAITLPAVRKAVIFEPLLFAERAVPAALLARLEGEVAAGRLAAALVTAMKGTRMGPFLLRSLPYWVLEPLISLRMAREDRCARGDDVTLRKLAATLHGDFRIATDAAASIDTYAAITTFDLMLLGCSDSPPYLRYAMTALHAALPRAAFVELEGLNHMATRNAKRGSPARVAEAVRPFLA